MKAILITRQELLATNLRPVYYIAHKLKDAGFEIEFNKLNIFLEEKDIEFNNIKKEITINGDVIFTSLVNGGRDE